MSALMPAVIVVIACKTVAVGPPDENAAFTNYENRQWAIEHSMMTCRRHEIQLYDSSVDQGAAPLPFSPEQCRRAGPAVAADFDRQNKNSPWKTWKTACPVATINTQTGQILAWTLPDCGSPETVVCEKDTAI